MDALSIKNVHPDADTAKVTSQRRPHPLMDVLASGVPLTLLVDIAAIDGPESARIFTREVADMSWLDGLAATPQRASPAAVAG